MMNLSKYVACICEGSAERAIIKLLLDENRLIFTWDNLLDGEILRCRNAKKFEEQHLRKGFTGKQAFCTVYLRQKVPKKLNY